MGTKKAFPLGGMPIEKGKTTMGKEAKTNAMRILEREKVPYTAHEYAHEEGVAVDGVTVAASMGEDPACVYKRW